MTGIHDLGWFVLAGLLLNLTPGPDMAYIAARSAAGGFRAGVAATLGITAGCVVHTLAAALGLSALVAASATAFTIVKWVGALYLLYAGARMLAASLRTPAAGAAPARSVASAPAAFVAILREAFLINLFNPKVALFFLAFLPQFIEAEGGRHALAFVALGFLFNANSLLVNLPVAWLASSVARRWRDTRAARVLQGAAGGVFVLLAARVATTDRT
jgi:threonine/homoserine/homoserine lactone efflux protein